jgi:hypothetical protein
MSLTSEQQIVRRLAEQVRQIADLPEMADRRQRWIDHNGLRPVRPLVLCFPEGAWSELLPSDECECTDPLLRQFEYALRRTITWWHRLHDDNLVDPVFKISWVKSNDGYGVDIVEHRTEHAGGSAVWDPPLKDLPGDLDKLHYRHWSVDRAETQRRLDLADSIFGDLLDVQVSGGLWWTTGLTNEAIRLVGLEQLMMLMMDDPSATHQLMAWLRDEQAHGLAWHEQQGVLGLNSRDDYVGSGGVGYTEQLPQPDHQPGEPARLIDRWGFAESQETVGISPQMFAEFILPYQVPLLNQFGLACYGCCEPVEDRLDLLLEHIPRLRRVSGSPWVDQQKMKNKIGNRCIFSRKPNPTQICAMFDEDAIRADLRQTLRIAGHGPLEIIMKDTHTVQNEPDRLTRWVQIALEEVDRYMQAEGSAARQDAV